MTTYRGICIVKNAARIGSVVVLTAIALTGFTWNLNVANAGPGKRGDAATPIRAEAYRIAVVNRKKAFDEYKKQQIEWASLQKELDAKQKVADQQSDAINAAQKKFAEDKSLTKEQKEAMALKIQEDMLDYQTAFKKLQNEIDIAAKKFFDTMMKDVDAAVQAVGNEGNYHLIFEADPNPASGTAVLFFSATIDVTPQVIQKLNGGK